MAQARQRAILSTWLSTTRNYAGLWEKPAKICGVSARGVWPMDARGEPRKHSWNTPLPDCPAKTRVVGWVRGMCQASAPDSQNVSAKGDLLRARILYMGASKCYISMPEDSFEPKLAYVSPNLLQRGGDEGKIVVGDFVMVRQAEVTADTGSLDLCVVERAERRNLFCRRSPQDEKTKKNTKKIIAANIDQLVVISSFGNPPFSSRFVDRVLVAAHLAGIDAMIVVNKLDLDHKGLFKEIRATYEAAGYAVCGTQANDGVGIEDLRQKLLGKVSALYGITGTGKSSLLNSLGGLKLRVGEVSESLHSGRHTTTASTMYRLKSGEIVIDTPGVRSFRPFGSTVEELYKSFPDIASLAPECSKGTWCAHVDEPERKCAVKRAVTSGALPLSRYESYLHMMVGMLYGNDE